MLADTIIPALIASIIPGVFSIVVVYVTHRTMKYTKQQMSPNGGSTLRDAVDRIDSRTEMVERRMLRFESRMDSMSRRMTSMERSPRDTGKIPAVNVSVEIPQPLKVSTE